MDLPPFETFLSPKRTDDFWQLVKYFLFYVAPIIVLFLVPKHVGRLISIVRTLFSIKKDRKKDKDDDFEIYRY